jgi:sugar porter (SP) family MFS transporter
MISGALSDRFGRKSLLLLSAVLFAVSSLLTGWAPSFSLFATWRILGGVAIGIASNVSPTYIAEMSPAVWRGRLVSLNQLTIVIGILLAQIVNLIIAERVPDGATSTMIRASWNGQTGWRHMFIAVAVPSFLFFFSSLFVPESPRWLATKGLEERAIAVFTRIGGAAYAHLAIRNMRTAEHVEASRNMLPSPNFRRALLIGVALAALQQWSGINILFNYAEEVYRAAGYGVNDVLFNIVITGAINLVFTLLALRVVDNWGRRPLMLFGCAGIAISHLLIGFGYHLGLTGFPMLLFTLLTIGCYAMSLAPVTWVIISEIFPTQFRGVGVSISVSALWVASFLLTFTFPVLRESLGPSGTFFLYAANCTAGLVFVYLRVPETKGKSLEQIEEELNQPARATFVITK